MRMDELGLFFFFAITFYDVGAENYVFVSLLVPIT